MNGLVLLVIAMVVLIVAYVVYGRYLERTWGVDPNAKTPAIKNGMFSHINFLQLRVLGQ